MPKFLRKHQVQRIQRRFLRLYGSNGYAMMERFYMMIGRYGIGADVPSPKALWNEDDVVLITYADIVKGQGHRPLLSLKDFCSRHLKTAISTVHILPFTTWSSDDGFSVIDYREVDPRYGKWNDVEALDREFDLMFDLVLNHCSSESAWFKDYVTGIAPARYYFLEMDPDSDLSEVVRPRSSPLLTRTWTRDGETHVWTTFSADQVDLNWQNPDVLFEFLDILLLYLSKGVRIIRMDAVAFLWKKIGTSCIHLPQTHQIVKLFRDVLEFVAPQAIVLTETNVPHEENVSYFGHGDEAHIVYNFSLPPLTLYSLLKNDSSRLSHWTRNLENPPSGCTFFNFTASHDGIGVRPLHGLVEDSELDWLVGQVHDRGGFVNMRRMPDGSEKPYELNITYVSALSDPDDEYLSESRFLCSQAIMLAFRGIPAVYFHSLTGTPNYTEGIDEEEWYNRKINRRKYRREDLDHILADGSKSQARIFSRYLQMLRRRSGHAAFHPLASMQVHELGPDYFCFSRTATDKSETIVCVFNFTPREQKLRMNQLHESCRETGATVRDILSATSHKTGPRRTLTFDPYQAMWLVVR